MKFCSNCERDLLDTMFSKHSGNEDGLSSFCKSCGGTTYTPVVYTPTYCTSLTTNKEKVYARSLLTHNQETLLYALNPYKDRRITYKDAAFNLGITEAGVAGAMMRLKKDNPYVYYRFKEITKRINIGERNMKNAKPTDPKDLELYEKYSIVKEIFT